MDVMASGSQVPGVTRDGNSFTQTPGNSGPSALPSTNLDQHGNDMTLTDTLKSQLGQESGDAPAAAVFQTTPAPVVAPQVSAAHPVSGYRPGDPLHDPKFSFSPSAPLPAATAPISDLSQDPAMPFASRRRALVQGMAEPLYADGGKVETTDELMARMSAKYGVGSGKTPAPQPSPTPPPAPQPPVAQPKPSGIGGIIGLMRGRRKEQLDKAIDGYANGGVIGFKGGGELLEDLERKAQETASKSPTPSPASQANPAGQAGIASAEAPSGANRWSTNSGMQGPGNTSGATPQPSPGAATTAEYDAEVRARAAAARAKVAQATPADFDAAVQAKAANAAKAAEGAAAEGATVAKAATGAAEAGTEAANVGRVAKAVNAVKAGGAGLPAKAIKGGLALAPVIGAYSALHTTDDEINKLGDSLNVDTTTNGGKMVARTADFLNKTGNAATFGLATPVGEAVSDAATDPKYDYIRPIPIIGGATSLGLALADKVKNWWNRPAGESGTPPANGSASAGQPEDGTLEKSVLAASGQGSGATVPPQDGNFTQDSTQPAMRSGAVRIGAPTGAVTGQSSVSADQLQAPAGGGYITNQQGRAIFVPGAATDSAAPAGPRDAYGNSLAVTNDLRRQLRELLQSRYKSDLESGLPYYQERGKRGLAALSAADNTPEAKAVADIAVEKQRSQDRIAESQAAAGIEGLVTAELRNQLAQTTDPVKRQELLDQATNTKGRYTVLQDAETESPMGNKLKGRQFLFDNKLGKVVEIGGPAAMATPSESDVKVLRDHAKEKGYKEAFDLKYGQGASDRALAGKYAHGGCIGGIGFCNGGKVRFARGGEVIEGAGNGTSDSVPAHVAETGQPIRVSAGEYELSPDAAQRFGIDNLNHLIDKYHQGESRPVPQGSFIVPEDVVKRLGVAYFDQIAKGKNPPPLPR